MDINKCKICGKQPKMAEPMQYWFSLECCDQHIYDESPDHIVFLWNQENTITNTNALAMLANDTNISINFKEMFAGA